MRIQSIPFLGLLCCLFLSVSLINCSSDSNENSSNSNNEDNEEGININIDTEDGDVDLSGLKNSIDDLENKLNELNDGKKVEVVNFRELKKLMPPRIAGMDRIENNGEKVGALGFKVSTANAKYREDDKRIEVSIADVGGIGMALSSMAAWSLVEVDRESEHEYERSTTIDGHKAFEKYNSKSERGEINMIIDDRYIVSIKGWNVTERELNKARKAIDIDDLLDLG